MTLELQQTDLTLKKGGCWVSSPQIMLSRACRHTWIGEQCPPPHRTFSVAFCPISQTSSSTDLQKLGLHRHQNSLFGCPLESPPTACMEQLALTMQGRPWTKLPQPRSSSQEYIRPHRSVRQHHCMGSASPRLRPLQEPWSAPCFPYTWSLPPLAAWSLVFQDIFPQLACPSL